MKVMFKMCDTNGDGYVSCSELAEFMGGLGGSDGLEDPFVKMMMGQMVAQADKDQGGNLTLMSFAQTPVIHAVKVVVEQ